jgi:dolichol-phosphate mannosyltransferase
LKLSIVIPARNEERNIGDTVAALTRALDSAAVPHEIVVVDDGSGDGTGDAVEALSAADPRVRLVRNHPPNGFGRAVRKGIESVAGEATVICMADGSDSPEDVVRYYRVLRDEAECVFGSRFIAGARVYDYPRFKLVVNRLANWFIRQLFRLDYNDITNAFKGYRTYVLQGCQPLLSPHFNLTVEMPLKAIVRGYSYKVVPISWRNRRFGVSALHLEEQGSRYLYIVLNVWLEKLLTGKDYKRVDAAHSSRPAGPLPQGGGASQMPASASPPQ